MRVDRVLRDRMTAQRSAEGIAPSMESLESTKISPKRLTRSLVAAALTLAATIFGIAAWTSWNNSSNDFSAAVSHWDELRRRVDEAEASQHFPAIPQMHFASVGTHKLATPVNGYIVEDRPARQWHLYAFRLPKLEKGHSYQVWFDLGDSRFVRAGTADIDDEGTIRRLIDVPSDFASIHGVAISDESGGEPERPSGENLIEAKLP